MEDGCSPELTVPSAVKQEEEEDGDVALELESEFTPEESDKEEAYYADFLLDAKHHISPENLDLFTSCGRCPDVLLEKITITSEEGFMDGEISLCSKDLGEFQSPEVEMENKNKDLKHENKRGKPVYKNKTNQFSSSPTGNPCIATRASHELSNCTQSDKRKYSCYLCSAKFRLKSCLQQHLQIHSGDIVLWLKYILADEIMSTQLTYWKDKLIDSETLNIITDCPRPSKIDHAGQDTYFELGENTSINLRNLAKELKVSIYTLLLSGYYLMLRSYSNQDDIVIGTLVANKHYSWIERNTKIIVSTSPLRIQIDSTCLLTDFIRQVGGDIITSRLHQDLPFEKVVEKLAAAKDASRHPIIQVMFGLKNFETSLQNQIDEENDKAYLLEPCTVRNPHNVAKSYLTTVIDDSGGILKGVFNYATSLFREETINGFIETYAHILSQLSTLVADKTNQKCKTIAGLSYLSAEQYHQIIYKWNATDIEYPADKTIPKLFEEQVAKTPANVATVYEKVRLTYRELNERANRLANFLKEEYNIEPDILIPLCLDRSEHMLIAILGVLKSGGAYVPIDPSYPDERIQYILQDTSARLLLTNEIQRERLERISCSGNTSQKCLEERHSLGILSIDSQEFKDKLSLQAVTNPNTTTTSTHLAYIIYTSGTTGMPKGVMVEHKRFVNFNNDLNNRYALDDTKEREVILQFSNYAFELSVEQIIFALLNGHNLLLIPNQLWLNTEKFNDYLCVNKVTHIHAPPRFLEQQNFSRIIGIKRLVSAGEILSEQSYDKIRSNDNIDVINAYGSTETSLILIGKIVKKSDLNKGAPVSNTKCYVLTDNLVPVPVGAIGELFIGGTGLARGYLNQPNLTAQRFIENPFQTEQEKQLGNNTRLYRTGDLVRWSKDCVLEYIGRNDLQVKIRGYRIELGEIESALSAYEGIKQSVALAKAHYNVASQAPGSKYLVGYYVSDKNLDKESILNYLRSKLPNYMVPTILVHLNKLPLTINGKLDIKALSEPELTNQDNYIAPRNEIEEKACQIWAEVLGLNADKIGTHEDFFRLGGDSIISIQLASRLRNQLRLNVSVKDIFNCKSIASLYENVFLEELSMDCISSAQTDQGILIGAVPLLPLQKRLFWRNFRTAFYWDQYFLIKTPKLDLGKLQGTLVKLVQHHDCFRLKYRKDDRSNTYEQYYDRSARIEPLKVIDICTLGYEENSQAFKTNLQQLLTHWQANFDLMDKPMYNVSFIFGYQDGSARIHFALHHLIADAISWHIVCEDLRAIYYGKIFGTKGSSYRQWVKIVKDYPSKHQEEQRYWNNILSEYNGSRLINAIKNEFTAHFTRIELGQEYTSLLLQESNQAYQTQIIDLLLTALGYSLTKITGGNIIHIMLEGNGREEIGSSIDISRTVGWFTTIYPVRLKIVDALGTTIRSVKESLRTIPHKMLGFGPILGYKTNASPKVGFNYLGQFGHEKTKKQKDGSIWQVIGKDGGSVSPDNLNTNVINFNGLILDGRLQFNILSKLDEKTTHFISSAFKKGLEVVIIHTIVQKRNYLTVSDIDHILNKEKLDALQESREIEAIYSANNLQQGFIYHALNQGEVDDAYLVQQYWQYHCQLNINNLKLAWGYAQNKFSSLRLRFDWQENMAQIINKEDYLDWRYIDLSDVLNVGKQEDKIKAMQDNDRLERYDLAQGNLFRIYLIKQNWDLYSCIFSNHHAILDGWSMPILLGFIHDTYLKLNRKELIFLQPDYAYKAAQKYIQEHREDNKDYWDKYVAQVEERTDLSALLLSSDKRLSEYKHIIHPKVKTLAMSGNLYNSLKKLCQKEGVTLNAILQYVWHKVLNVYGNNKQTIVGATVSGRSLPVDDIEKSVGLYINTLPLIVDHQSNKRLINVIKDIQSSIIEFNGRSNVNLAKLQSSAERLFDSLFVYENYPNPHSAAQDKVKLKFKSLVQKLDYPLNVKVFEANKELIFQLHYAGELFSDDTVSHLLHLTMTLLEQLPSRAHQKVSNLRYLNAQQYDQIIHRWNATDKEYPANKTIHQLFEKQVENTPDNVGIVFKEVQLTYKELNERANRLAMYLIKEFNIKPDSLIALCLDRSEHMLIAILAVLKSGGAYVPIDPRYPYERIQYILRDTGTSLLVTNEIHHERLANIHCLDDAKQECLEARQPLCILSIDSRTFKDKLSLQAVSNPNTDTTSGHLAYVIYTSGTTGKPKGVMIEHRGLVNLNSGLIEKYALSNAKDREVILQFSNYVFDASVEQIVLGLLNGHVLLLVPNQLWLSREKFIDYLVANEVTHIHVTPRIFEEHNFREISSLKRLVSAGEALSEQSYKKIRLTDSIDIINVYGPTETTVSSLVNIIQNGDLNIGSPISNTRCYVLGENLVPVPVGAIGELYISGVGVARGYLNCSDLTEERFIANPFQTEDDKKLEKHTRLYKTGDLVRWLQDGNLEYIGRNDLQVKIKGYRIELGEIESALSGYKGIKQSVALAKEHNNVAIQASGGKYLVGYYVSDEKLDDEAILCYLASKLPDYMVPTILVQIDKLPLTMNGKLDRRSLPDSEFTSQNNYVAPRNEIEEKTCQIWAELLGLNADKIGTHDDFFRLGGDSIISIQLVSRLRKELQINVTVKSIFNNKSIARLYENVLENDLGKDKVLSLQNEHGILVGAVPLLAIQEWFFGRNFSAAHHWNQSFLIKTPRLDLGRLYGSLNKLIQHHDCFRLRYKKKKLSSSFEQYYDSNAKLHPVMVLDISTLGYRENSQAFKTRLSELFTTWQANFDLTGGPMYSVGYIYGYQDGSARIHFALHHLIVDAVSWRIVTEDLRDLYYGSILSGKGSSYRQWATTVRDFSSKHQEKESFWNNILSDYDSSRIKNLIVNQSPAHLTSMALSREYTSLLLKNSNQAYHTQVNDLLLTALAYTLTEITGSNINHVLLEDHGREQIDNSLDMTRTLGRFTTIYPVRLEVVDALGTSIRSMKESLRMIPHKGLGFVPIKGYKYNALPRICFNYLGQFTQESIAKPKDNNIWQIVQNDCETSINPKNWDTNVINFNGVVMDGRLEFSIVSKLDEKTTKDLASVFKNQLEVIINHTINQPRGYLTVSDTDYVVSRKKSDALQESRETEAIYLANNLQQGFIFHDLSQGDVDDPYLVQQIWQYHCSLNINNLKQAWLYAQDKFSSLRVRFDWQEDLVQVIDKDGGIDWRYIDLSYELNIGKQESTVKRIQEKDRLERYNLAHGNLFRIYLIKQKWDLYSCIFSNHHAIIDGWSMPILLSYIHDTYLRLDRKELIFVQPDYAYEAAQQYTQKHQNEDKAYWDQYISQVKERMDLSGLLLNNRKSLSEYKLILHPTCKTLTISGDLYNSLKLLSQQEGVTLNAILQYVWHKVLRVYGNNKQTIVGTTVSGRSLPIEDIEKSVGLYINTLPLIVDHQSSKHLIEFIKDIQSSISEFNGRSNVNLAKLQSSDERLFDSLFDYEKYPNPASVVREKFELTFTGSIGKLGYPLNVKAFEANKELNFQLHYAGELFSDDTMSHLLHLTMTLLEQFPSGAHQAVTNLRYLNTQQFDQIIHRWNATDKEFPADKTIHQLFENQVAKTPDNIAIVYIEVELTYKELNERANRVATYLIKEFNIEPDRLIALCLDRSEHMLIAIMAVLKSGGAYVPIDPSYPNERIQYILRDTGTSLLVTNEIHHERLANIHCLDDANQECLEARQPPYILSIDSQAFKDKLSLQAVSNPNTDTRSGSLAYVIYTSGTTGKPKGVMIEHKGLVNLNSALVDRYTLGDANDEEVILQFFNYAFDASVEQIILGLLNGHVLLLIPNQLWLSKEKFNNYLLLNKVTHIPATPRFLEQHNFSNVKSLKRIICGGDVLSYQSYNKIRQNGSMDVINGYGPTETSVISMIKIIKNGDLNIGAPISNTRCYVLGNNLVPLPVGAIGELYIGGAGVARGYFNRPDLTKERFIANPFQTEEESKQGKHKKLYKSGDLVRWVKDGNLEYIGRIDLQIKIRGYRIELGEIERVMSAYDGIRQSIALAKEHNHVASQESGSKYLVGYYVSDEKLDEEAILCYLTSKLPDYMVPTILVHLKKLPLTVNGKLDRKALPDPEFTNEDNYVAPRNEIEEKVCKIWAEVLGLNVDKIGTHDDFFRLGGDSIISIQLVNRLRKVLQINVTVKNIFISKSIARLCENVLEKELSKDKVSSLQNEHGILVGAVALLPIQEWFFTRNFSAAHHWNQSFLMKVPRLDLGRLRGSLNKLIQHHDCFRLRYKKNKNGSSFEQYYDGYAKLEPVKILDISTLGYQENSQAFKTRLKELFTTWQANFDLTDGPMHSFAYLYGYQDGSARIHFALHHLIVDAVSWRIVSEDLRDIYYGSILSGKGSSYRQWATTVRDYYSKRKKQESFWNNILSDYDSSRLKKLILSESTAHSTIMELSQEYTGLLLQKSNQAYHTQINDLLLTALAYTLTEITGSNINHVLLEGHGREQIDNSLDMTRTLGWFTTIYPVRLEVVDSLGASIRTIKESLRMIPHKGLGFGPIMGYKSNAVPRISFNYLGQFTQENSAKPKDNNVWQIVENDGAISVSPKNRDSNVININGLVMDGRLEFGIVSKLDVEMTNEIGRVFKEQLLAIISHCVNNPTIEYTISDFEDFEPVVVRNQESLDRNNLIMFPPSFGGAECYFRNIVPRLRNKRLIIFNNFYRYLEKKLGKNYTKSLMFEQLAEDYVTYIKSFQPKGPYNLFGWSIGGVLAFEISKKLISRGDYVANLILLDSYFIRKNKDLKISIKSSVQDKNNIKYPTCSDTEMLNTHILLFKATKVEEIDFYKSMFIAHGYTLSTEEIIELRKTDKFYAKQTEANNLDQLLKNHRVEVVPINYSHYSWVHSDDALQEICVRLEEL